MRKTIALLLAALFLLSSVPALAQEYTLDRKLQLQLLNGSGLTGSAAFSLTPGLKMTALDDASNTLLAALLPGAALDLKYIRSTSLNKGQEDLSLTMKKNNAQAADLRYTTDGVLESLASSLMGSQAFVTPKGDGRMASLLMNTQLSVWPGLERALWAMNNSDNSWRAKAETAMKPYLDKLSLWLQPFTKITSGQDSAGKPLTINTLTVPAAALKAEIKQLLADAYRDNALMTLLRGQFSAAETVAYLQPTMLPGFQAAIDRLPLTSAVSLTRHYDQSGQMIRDELSLPMAGAWNLESLKYRYELNARGESSVFIECFRSPADKTKPQGGYISLAFTGGRPADALEGDSTFSYTGTLTLQPESAAQGFTVDTAAGAPKEVFDFNFNFSAAKEVYNEVSKVSTQDYDISLLVKPQNIEGLADQSVTLKAQFNSALGDSKATRFTGRLVWTDMSTGSAISADISGSSAAPWVIPTVNTLGAVRLDSLSAQSLTALMAQLRATLQTGLLALVQSFLVTSVP